MEIDEAELLALVAKWKWEAKKKAECAQRTTNNDMGARMMWNGARIALNCGDDLMRLVSSSKSQTSPTP